MSTSLRAYKYQQGAGLIQWIAGLAILGLFGLFLVKVTPIYMENRLVQTGLKSLTKSGDRLGEISNADIRKRLDTFYMINNVKSRNAVDGLAIDRSGADRVIVKIDYEERVNFISNIDLVLTFENHLDSSLPDFCCKPKAK